MEMNSLGEAGGRLKSASEKNGKKYKGDYDWDENKKGKA